MKPVLPAAFLATIAFALPAFGADDPILSKLAGDWIGRGTYKQSATAQPERIYCRIVNTLENGTALQQRGRCSVASNSGSVDGLISAEGGGRYGGTLNSLASEGPAKLNGTGSGNRVVLNMSFVDTVTEQPVQAVTTMEVKSGGYRLTTERKDPATGATWTASDIDFAAK